MATWRIFFVWILPLLWAACSLVQSQSPGDENGFYVVSSLPAAWMAPFLLLGHASKEMIPIYVVLAGLPIMVGVGWVMDRLEIRKVVWAIVYLVAGITIFFLVVGSFPSLERAIGKNGSLWAYVVLASNLGLYASVILSVILNRVERGMRWLAAVSKEAQQRGRESDMRPHD